MDNEFVDWYGQMGLKEDVDLALEEARKQGALDFWKKLKVKIENEDFEHWVCVETNDKYLDKEELFNWVEKELGQVKP